MSRQAKAASALGLGLLVLGVVAGISSAYTLDETEQAVIIQFGAPVGDPIVEPGLHFKRPFVQEVRRFDQRLLIWDGDPNQIPTRGREFISVDTTARWRISDPLAFLRSVRDEAGAQSRLDDIIDSVVRDQISSTELVEIVRSEDWKVTSSALQRIDVPIDEEDRELTKKIRVGRENLTRDILAEAKRGLAPYGIDLVDVRIKRLNYVPSVQEQVFNRMISERQRIAQQFRSEGAGEAARIRGETEEVLAGIRSEARRAAEILQGEADAAATRIYADAYGESPAFFELYRTLESYRRALSEGTILLLDIDSQYLQYLEGGVRDEAPQKPEEAPRPPETP